LNFAKTKLSLQLAKHQACSTQYMSDWFENCQIWWIRF